jgi:hypothetical protein
MSRFHPGTRRAAEVRQHHQRPWTIIRSNRRTIVNASLTHPAPATHAGGAVPGTDRLLGRSQTELADAMTWLAWYAPGVFTAVMDYMDHVDGELIPALM